MAVLDEDLERSLLNAFRERMPAEKPPKEGVALDLPGTMFRIKGRSRWVELRLVSIIRREVSARGVPDDVLVRAVCYQKVEAKGNKELALSQLVDITRRAIDTRLRALPIRIINGDGQEVGVLNCGPVSESRAYNITAQVRGDSIPGLDSATLTVPCKLDGSPCP